jgi:CPA2 family monovalent cation:H+ antiporter-2
MAGHAIVVGYGRVGSELTRLLKLRGVDVVVIDAESALVDRARADGLPVVRGNAANPGVLAEALPKTASTAMVAIPNALEAGEIIAALREANPSLSILARGHSDGEVRHLLEHGADAAVMAERELAHSLAEMVLSMPQYRTGPLPPAGATL